MTSLSERDKTALCPDSRIALYRYVLPGECYIDVFMALLGGILFKIKTGRTVKELSAPSGCSE